MKKVFLFIILYISTLSAYAQFPITMTGYPIVTTGWTWGGTGAAATDSSFRITTAAGGEANHVYYNTAVNMGAYCSFTAEFDFQITSSSSGVADGLAFWFLSNPPTTGGTGSAIGLPNYPNGMILILDTYNNDGPPSNTPLETLLGYSGTTAAYVEGASTGTLCSVNPLQSFITNGAWHHVKLVYNLGNINVYFNYSATAAQSGYYDLSGISAGYFGFSASTGAVYSTQKVKRVNIVASNCLTMANNGPICEGDTLKLYAIGDSTGKTYSWTGPGGFTSTDQNPVIPYATIADSGIYRVVRGLDTGYTDVAIKLKPIVTATNNSTICSGSDLIFAAGPDSLGETFSWSGPNGYTSATENPTITAATQTDTGFYTVIANWDGCLDTSTTHVNIIYVAVPTANNNTPICEGDSIVLTAADAAGGVSYSWAGPGGFSSALQNPVIHGATVANAGTYTVTAYNGICSYSATTNVVVNILPVEPDILTVTPIPICSGIALTLHATDLTPGVTFHWTGPIGFTSISANPVIPNIPTSASGIYSVYATLAGCVSMTNTVSVTVDSTPEVPVATNNGPLCSGSTLVLTSFSPTSGISYHWTSPSGTFTSTLQNPSITNVNITENGTYTVTVTSGSCSSSGTTLVTIYQTPSTPTVGNNGPVCAGGLLVLSAVAIPGSGIYYWSGPNSFTSVAEYPSISNVTLAANGVYSVYEVLNGCTSPIGTTTVVILPSPAVPTASGNSPVCQGDTILLHSADDSVVTFAWSGPAGFTSAEQNPVILNADPSEAGLYLVTATQGTCSKTATVSIAVTPTPPLTATNNGPLCSGDTLKLFANSAPGITFAWTGPFGYVSAGQNPMRYPISLEYAGVYTVTASTTVALGSCTNTVLDTVVIHESPGAPWVTWLTFCQGYDAPPLQAVDATDVMWFPSAAAGGVGTATPPIPATDVPGIYYFYLNETVNGCVSPIDSIQVIVNPKPVVTVSPLSTYVCPHDSVVLTATDADPLDTYHWYPDTYMHDTLKAVTTVRPITDQNYMMVVDNRFGCTDTAYAQIHVYPAGVIYLGVGDSVTLYTGQSYQLTPTTNCSALTWFPPYGLSADNISDPVASPTTNTMYVVTGTTENGCMGKDSVYFHVSDETIFAAPNAFTPGTGTNNEFKLIEQGLGSLNYLRIFDRWGVLVFETHNINAGWDGNYKGAPQPMGVYIYEMQAVSSRTGKLVNMQGNITLLR